MTRRGTVASVLALVLAAALSLGACAPATPSSSISGTPSATASDVAQPPSKDATPVTMTVAYFRDPVNFNGILNNLSWTTQIMVQMFNRLITYDGEYNVVGDLAESWEISPDGRTWTFHLADGVTWHDGKPFSSADVKGHFERVAAAGNSPTAVAMKKLRSIETPDDATVVFSFADPVQVNVFAAVYADQLILPNHLFAGIELDSNPANLAPVGTGPFKFVAYEPGVSVELVANPDYFKGAPAIDRLIYRIMPDQASALLALRAGEVDVIEAALGIPVSEVEQVRNDPNLRVDAWPYYTTVKLAFNMRPEAAAEHAWLADKQVREAIAMSIDRDFLVDRVLQGVTKKANSIISETVAWAHNGEIAPPDYDPARAEEILDAAGWPRRDGGVRFSFEMPVQLQHQMGPVSEAMVEMLRNVGIEMKAIGTESAAYLDTYMRGVDGLSTFPMTMSGVASGPHPAEIYQYYHSSRTPASEQPGFNYYFFDDPEVDRLLDEAMATFDQDVAAGLWKQVQLEATQDLWAVPLYDSFRIETWNAKFTGFAETHRPIEWFVPYAGITPAG